MYSHVGVCSGVDYGWGGPCGFLCRARGLVIRGDSRNQSTSTKRQQYFAPWLLGAPLPFFVGELGREQCTEVLLFLVTVFWVANFGRCIRLLECLCYDLTKIVVAAAGHG